MHGWTFFRLLLPHLGLENIVQIYKAYGFVCLRKIAAGLHATSRGRKVLRHHSLELLRPQNREPIRFGCLD